jgi:hypothetical protein
MALAAALISTLPEPINPRGTNGCRKKSEDPQVMKKPIS